MDELALLKRFRVDDSAPNGARDHARRVLYADIARRRSRRRYILTVAFAVAAVLAGAAYGIARELLVGEPAPQEIKQALARFGHEADLIPHPHPGDPIVDQAKVAAVLDSSAGRVYLFSVPGGDRLCGWVWVEGARGYQGKPDMSSVCGNSGQTFWAMGLPSAGTHIPWLFWGRVGDGVARATLVFGERRVELPLSGRWFLAEFDQEGPTNVIAYDRQGDVIEDGFHFRPPQFPPTPRIPSEVAHQVGQARALLELHAESGELITLEVAASSDGGSCMIVRSDKRPTNRGCGIAKPTARGIEVSPMQFGGAPGGVQLLVGPLGSEIAKLKLRYQDGRYQDIPLRDGWTLYEIAKADYTEGRRPAKLVGLDATGEEIATKRLPWASGGQP